MTKFFRAFFVCLALFTLSTSIGIAQDEPPVEDDYLPEGAVDSDGRLYFNGDLMSDEPLQALWFIVYEMKDDDEAEDFYDGAIDELRKDDTSRESKEKLRGRNDQQILVNTESDDDSEMSFILFQKDEYVGIWMAIDVDGRDKVLADLYDDFYSDGFDKDSPFPGPEDVPKGFESFGGE